MIGQSWMLWEKKIKPRLPKVFAGELYSIQLRTAIMQDDLDRKKKRSGTNP
jgi:hypothetical protein